ncbi:hypothetical protein ACIG0D_29720 [Streptomyces sp. NPDC052773]|uniref:hypothetical protein n=1 Tax=Streptomyces sp. NPDC052773 TaxID=3365693 RepID=UPI0037D8F059
MAFGVEELRVLRRALALALHPGQASPEDVQDCLRLADSLDEAMREAARLRAFLVADLARYRAALPGTAAGYLTLLEETLGAGHRPTPDDLAALRALRGNPTAAALLGRCQTLAEQDVRARLARRAAPVPGPAAAQSSRPNPLLPASRTRLLALPGGRCADDAPTDRPARETEKKPAEKPAAPTPTPSAPQPPTRRPIPTPGEVFPRRKPPQPPANPPQQLAVG